ncbi:MAG: hypothetical protein MUO42_01280 [Anaerolineaceae bacterium]|nr:hypothetical protein [Anaerolineaceae bacterium]
MKTIISDYYFWRLFAFFQFRFREYGNVFVKQFGFSGSGFMDCYRCGVRQILPRSVMSYYGADSRSGYLAVPVDYNCHRQWAGFFADGY